ncbi:CPBP family intramembrane metalloprotease [Bradyrhizobium liaoningense]|uniref:CPBP family intramembrane glutamic endopeptidase n=1 Tax=Bradyrhizobium liaoningense TaxID=43992 RepID=UPI001BA89603|nr:CPBP family intramembrane glutamic endopeptidase [Bradyrhizobium liaoningense]MBR0839327.1 CPBP family intramembrane metalloprotease [Bradyrhizobium liaoningense]MBR0860218.1 CPBP family intramembrane metalloprotease [Bradyrhizobium liaoningense]
MRDFIRTNAVLSFYVLAFAISWGGVVAIAGGPQGFPADAGQMQRLLPAVVLAMVAGPSLAGIVMTAYVSGAAGLRALLSRILTWRVGAIWYGAALFIAPMTVVAVLLALTLVSPDFLPAIFGAEDKAAILLPGLAAGLVAGLFEEIGWTGFAIPRLRSQFGFVATGLIVGGLWGLWHFAVALWGSGTASGQLAPVMFLSQIAFYAGVLPTYRLLMLWVHDRTGSLLLAMLMHGSLTAATTFVFAPPVNEAERLAYHLVLACAFWILAATVAARRGRVDRH